MIERMIENILDWSKAGNIHIGLTYDSNKTETTMSIKINNFTPSDEYKHEFSNTKSIVGILTKLILFADVSDWYVSSFTRDVISMYKPMNVDDYAALHKVLFP